MATPDDPISKELDLGFVELKLKHELAKAYPKEPQFHTASWESVRARADWVRVSSEVQYAVYCDAWQRQGKQKSPVFVRWVHNAVPLPYFRDTIELFEQEVALHTARFYSPRDAQHFRELVHDIEREWETRIDLEMQESKYSQPITASPPGPNSLGSLSAPEFDHDPMYSIVRYKKITCHPTRTASSVISVLHRAYCAGRPEMRTEDIRKEAKLGAHGNMYDWIVKGGCADFWKTLIVRVRKGVYRLNLPDRGGTTTG